MVNYSKTLFIIQTNPYNTSGFNWIEVLITLVGTMYIEFLNLQHLQQS